MNSKMIFFSLNLGFVYERLMNFHNFFKYLFTYCALFFFLKKKNP